MLFHLGLLEPLSINSIVGLDMSRALYHKLTLKAGRRLHGRVVAVVFFFVFFLINLFLFIYFSFFLSNSVNSLAKNPN